MVNLFREAAEIDLEFVARNVLPIGVFAYLSRAYFENQQFDDGRRAAESALVKNQDDHFARLYLGLAAIRQGGKDAGRRDIESGLKGIYQWNEEIATGNLLVARFWDRGRLMRNEI